MDDRVKCAAFMGGQGVKARSIAYCNDGTTPTLKATPSGSNMTPDVVICLQGSGTTSCGKQTGDGFSDRGTAYTLNTLDVHGVCYPINLMVATRGGRDDMRTCFGIGNDGDPQFTLSSAHEHAVCYDMRSIRNMGDKAMTLLSTMHKGANANGCSIVLTENRSNYDISCFQNTGQGWWKEGQTGETLRCHPGSWFENVVVNKK